MPGHAVLVTFGSHGDLHPFLGLGARLRDRGWRVTLVTNDKYARDAADHGFDFLAIGTAEEFDAFVDNPEVWHTHKAAKHVFGALADFARPTHEALIPLVQEGTIFIGNTLAAGVRVLAETHGATTATMHLQPTAFRSMIDPPRMPGVPALDRLPAFLKAKILPHFWNGADRYVLDPLLKSLAAYRQELGLDPVVGYMDQWWHSPDRVLAMWPDWYAPPPHDWPEQTRLCGFPLYDERETATVDDELARWIDAGDLPIAFTPGSAMVFGEAFFAAAVEACRRLNRRGILLTRHARHVPQNLPASVRHVPFAPFSKLLPRCAAIVHHGGIGTMSQGFAAGIPQVVMPMAHDQPDNARRLIDLGVGDAIIPKRFKAKRLARVLGRLVEDDAVATRCADLKERVLADDGLARAADLVEDLALRTVS